MLWLALTVAAPSSLTVAIMDFQNLSQQPEHDYLQRAIPELLLTDLALSKKLTLVERTRLQEVMKELKLSLSGAIDSTTALKIGQLAGAQALILGSIIKAGNTFRIDVRLTDVTTGKITLAEKIQWTSEDDIINNIDQLAIRIIKKLTNEDVAIGPVVADSVTVTPGKPLSMETVLNNFYRLTGSTDPVYLQIDLFSKEIKTASRIPLNISLVIDRSGSMGSENKLENVKKAAEFVVKNLEKDDYLSIVTYESNVQTPVPARHPEDRWLHQFKRRHGRWLY
jgi:TolB-like protein